MNRERLLFVGVLAILALWFFVLLEPAEYTRKKVGPQSLKISRLPLKGTGLTLDALDLPSPGPFTLSTNETPHARPRLPVTEARDLPNIWPPSSRSVSLKLLGRLRRGAKGPAAEDAATIQLPELEQAATGGEEGEPEIDRLDQWQSFGRLTTGEVIALRVGNKQVRQPREFPVPGPPPLFFRLLVMLEIDPNQAAREGLTAVEVRFEQGGITTQAFPGEINNFRIGVRGRQQGWLIGARAYLKLPAKGFAPRRRAGQKLLEQGRTLKDESVLAWSLFILGEARKLTPAGAQNAMRDILLLMLEAANRLNEQERVLALGFEHLSRFPRETAVLEYMGNILSSRSYGLTELAISFYEGAASSKAAQRRRAALLIGMGRFDQARDLLDSQAAGAGVEVDLLRARVALAQGDYDTATARATPHASGEGPDAAEACQILGGVAYARGDAAAAETQFMSAVLAQKTRSTAYSDLGLALAVQGKGADAQVCFQRAMELDFENSVTPRLGAIFLKLSAEQYEEANTDLDKLREDNPRDLLVAYYVAFGKEKAGDLDGAATGLRAILDEDHRYRIAIARLGIVQARRREAGGADNLVRPAVALLSKAAELNADDSTVAYILGRFLMLEDTRRQAADGYFRAAQNLPAPAGDTNLPLWARAARAALLYRDEGVEQLKVLSAFNRVVEEVRLQGTRSGATDVNRYVSAHPVGRYALECREMVQENARKVDVTWTFNTKPRDWRFGAKRPMQISVRKGVQFLGTVNFQGQEVNHVNRLQFCAAEYPDPKLTGNGFYELIVEGEIPGAGLAPVDVGVGVVGTTSTRRKGRSGIQIRRRSRTQRAQVRLDGGETERFKRDKANNYIEMSSVDWPAGKFELRIRVEDRDKGHFSITLNDRNVFAADLGRETERCAIFGKGRGNRPVVIYIWVEGNDGDRFEGIYIRKVTLVRAGQ